MKTRGCMVCYGRHYCSRCCCYSIVNAVGPRPRYIMADIKTDAWKCGTAVYTRIETRSMRTPRQTDRRFMPCSPQDFPPGVCFLSPCPDRMYVVTVYGVGWVNVGVVVCLACSVFAYQVRAAKSADPSPAAAATARCAMLKKVLATICRTLMQVCIHAMKKKLSWQQRFLWLLVL